MQDKLNLVVLSDMIEMINYSGMYPSSLLWRDR